MVPLKLMRQRCSLPDQVFHLSSVEVDSPRLIPGSSPLSFCITAQDVTNNAGDVMESDNCSVLKSQPHYNYQQQQYQQNHRVVVWRHIIEDLLWLASAFFILYFGDLRSNFFSLLANDPRVLRTPLHFGSVCLIVDSCIIIFMAVGGLQVQKEKDKTASHVIQAATMIGLAAFILISIALWPIWSFLTVPMLFTLFMALMVVAPYILPFAKVKVDLESLQSLIM